MSYAGTRPAARLTLAPLRDDDRPPHGYTPDQPKQAISTTHAKHSTLTPAPDPTAGTLRTPSTGTTADTDNCGSTELCVLNYYGHDKNKGY
ncbi:hypothetical protein JHN63_15905 [Streptomyces sp. MBT65]|uniref:hypothetical protein n=1 Tax=Streptomyces sp. MBT65 TaxID=1488395 RepID=UPI00190AE5A2|nr:hypothetical protein [Streptomyces sp. MBT65]MBK3575271.1 hypothetical protein [Streptomyces sp. MBT65]